MAFDNELLLLNKNPKETISINRYKHSIGVMKKALEYAEIYNIHYSITRVKH